jgi:hypothetical protein
MQGGAGRSLEVASRALGLRSGAIMGGGPSDGSFRGFFGEEEELVAK